MHVETSRSHQVLRDGTERTYERHLLRRSFRDGGKVRKETLANLSHLPPEAITAVRAVLAGKTLIDADAAFEVTRSLPHGHAAAVAAMARKLGFPALLGPSGPHRDLACALVISRVIRPASKLSTAGWWDDVTLGPDLGVAGASTDEIYAAMDWLVSRQDDIEKQLAARHLAEGGIAMFDLSSSWVEGSHCELAAFGYSRDGKRGKAQIEYGLLTDKHGRPVAVRVRRQHRRPQSVPRGRRCGPRHVGPAEDDHGRGPGDDHLGADQGPARAGRHGVDHLPAPPRDQKADGRGRAAAAVAVR
jgi:hypothetical protein